jgi:hypothetical protein
LGASVRLPKDYFEEKKELVEEKASNDIRGYLHERKEAQNRGHEQGRGPRLGFLFQRRK